jgi:hypothetical protein
MSNQFSTYKIYTQLARNAYTYKNTFDIVEFGNQKYEVLIQSKV